MASTAVAVTSAQDAAMPPDAAGSFSASTVYTTSAAVTSAPSCHLASGRMVTVHDVPAALTVHAAARSGSSVSPGPSLTRPLKMRPTRVRSERVRAVTGVIDSGMPTTPSR